VKSRVDRGCSNLKADFCISYKKRTVIARRSYLPYIPANKLGSKMQYTNAVSIPNIGRIA